MLFGCPYCRKFDFYTSFDHILSTPFLSFTFKSSMSWSSKIPSIQKYSNGSTTRTSPCWVFLPANAEGPLQPLLKRPLQQPSAQRSAHWAWAHCGAAAVWRRSKRFTRSYDHRSGRWRKKHVAISSHKI